MKHINNSYLNFIGVDKASLFDASKFIYRGLLLGTKSSAEIA
jgi:hypothetical protein